MRTITIRDNDAGQRLDKYLSKRFRTMPKSLLYKYLRTKYIKLNGKKASPDTILSTGDELTLYIRDEFFELEPVYDFLRAGKELDIVYEDENLLLVNKKAGVIAHQDARYDADTLNLRALRYLYEKGAYDPAAERSFTPALCNRIDRNTQGLVIIAKNAAALRAMNRMIRDRKVCKLYLCITAGTPSPPHRTMTAYLSKDGDTNTVRVTDTPHDGSKRIVTEYRVLDSADGLSLCEVELHTGRTHQIRAHMAHIGHPLLGDNKYGDRALNRRYRLTRQALCAYAVRFDFCGDGDEMNYLDGRMFSVPSVWFASDGKLHL